MQATLKAQFIKKLSNIEAESKKCVAYNTARKMKFYTLRNSLVNEIWSHLLKKFLMTNFIFCAVSKKRLVYFIFNHQNHLNNNFNNGCKIFIFYHEIVKE